MHALGLRSALAFFTAISCAVVATAKEPPTDTVRLPNGWSLSPAGRQVELGGLPLKLVAIPGSSRVLVASNGYTQHFIALLDAENGAVLQKAPITEGWMGLALSPDGKRVYVSGGSTDRILLFDLEADHLTAAGEIPLPGGTFPAGLHLNRDGSRLYVTGNLANALLVVDLGTKAVTATVPVGNKPYTCIVTADERTAYVSDWGEQDVAVIDLGSKSIRVRIPVQEKPNDLLLTPDGKRLFVANGNRNTVSVIETASARVIEQIDVGLMPNAPLGSTPNAFALSADGATLFVANADNNALAVLNVSEPGHTVSRGFIPTGWYPAAVCITGEKAPRLVVGNGKGNTSMPNSKAWLDSNLSGRKSLGDAKNPSYIANLLEGTLSLIDLPDEAALARYSHQAHQNSPYATQQPTADAPFPLGKACPIKHVFYIIKENRTYDQVFGDVSEGDGDPALCLFPEETTPNHHALAKEFVLLDHFFHDAEVSADGHHWVTSAYATDYVEKFWPSMYAGRGQKARMDLHDDAVAYSAGGFIWDLCAKAGLTYRSYGEFARVRGADPGHVRPATPSLVGHHHPTYTGADAIGVITDMQRFEIWAEEFRRFAEKQEVPAFQVLSLPNDHTVGTRPGKFTPRAMLADNDLALGKIVETIARSPIWKESVIFVVEDDAQNGSDHVDCHRTVGLVVSPYTHHRGVDKTMYSTSSMLKTMELILGLPPMTQYDAAATPMWAAFRAQPNAAPYEAKPNRIPLDEKNTAHAYRAERSLELALDEADEAPEQELNEIVWKATRGELSEMPPRRVAAFVMERAGAKDDDER
jgi:YVTN family beta-propeller protein